MRILQISSAKTLGGGEKHLSDLCRVLKERGHEIFIALRKENEFEDRLHFLPLKNRLYTSLRNSIDVLSSVKIASLLKKQGIDIVHAHLSRDYPLASLAVRLYPRSRLILTRHVLFPMSNLHRLTLRNGSKFIAVSAAVEADLRKMFSEEKIVRISNGIDVHKWDNIAHTALRKEFRSEHEIPLDKPLIGTVGELKKLKGQKDFVIAAAEIVKTFPDAHFVMAGKDATSNQSYRRKLKHLVKILSLERRFIFLDWIEDTVPLLSALDVFVSPSHSESFGLAILEAMVSGCVVVATETGGAKELIRGNKTGLLTPIGDSLKLAESVCKILANEQKRKDIAKKSRDFASQNFTLKKMVDKTEAVYLEALS
jgi:glycosyltransferase involved in cell wall biosynthesis